MPSNFCTVCRWSGPAQGTQAIPWGRLMKIGILGILGTWEFLYVVFTHFSGRQVYFEKIGLLKSRVSPIFLKICGFRVYLYLNLSQDLYKSIPKVTLLFGQMITNDPFLCCEVRDNPNQPHTYDMY